MGLLKPHQTKRALDAQGAPVPFAKRYIYCNGTTFLCPIYQDEDLTIMRENPMIADESGNFDFCYVVDGAYSVEIKDDRGNLIAMEEGVFAGDKSSSDTAHSFRSIGEMLADTTLSYAQSVGRITVGPFAPIAVADGGFRYCVAASEALDHDLVTDGGVKIYARASAGKFFVATLDPAADGQTDDFAVIEAASRAAIREKAKLVFDRRTYLYMSPLTLTDVEVDFGGATLKYAGPVNSTALTLNSTPASDEGGWGFDNFTLKSDSVDTVNRTNGVCLGGSLGRLSRARILGFTGISLGLGSGVETYTGVTLSGQEKCYYWNIDAQVSSTAGWNLVVQASSNANNFNSFSTFPFDGFAAPAPRPANCINEFVLGGVSNRFGRVSLEASPSAEKVLFLASANANKVDSVYMEYNPLWETPPFPRISAQVQSSANEMLSIRHPYAGEAVNDLGTSNEIKIVPAFYVNGGQTSDPQTSENLLKNGDFENKMTGWSDYSNGTVLGFEAGYPRGKTLTMTMATGRPNILQRIDVVGHYNIAALIGKNVTVSAWIKTDLQDFHIRQHNQSQGNAIGDGEWHYYQSTIKVPDGATTHSVQMTTAGSGHTGYVHVSSLTVAIGKIPLAFAAPGFLEGEAIFNPPIIADGDELSTSVTILGASVGDFIVPAFAKDLQGIKLSAYVSSSDTGTFIFRNDTGASIDLGGATLAGRVLKA